jgi:hypothetical protein
MGEKVKNDKSKKMSKNKTKKSNRKFVGKSPQKLRADFLSLLGKEENEQVYQSYIEENTRLIPLEFVQNHGIHFQLVLRKVSFGADYKCDFLYLSKSSDHWNCVLVEIERPNSRFFKKSSNEYHPDFLKALQQIDTWKAWFLDPANHKSFTDTTLGLIRTPLGRNPTQIKYVLVHGRRAEYQNSPTKRRLIVAKESNDLQIITFDSLVENLESKRNLYLGVRRNEYVEILSDKFLDEVIFSRMQPEQLKISHKLEKNALAARKQWFHGTFGDDDKIQYAMDIALKGVRFRS